MVDASDVDDWIVLLVYIDSMKVSQDLERMYSQLRQLQQVHQTCCGARVRVSGPRQIHLALRTTKNCFC